MEKFAKVVTFVFKNRRMIGLLIGSTLTICGFPEYGTFATKVGAIE